MAKQSQSDKALGAARQAAQNALESLDVPATAAKALAGAMHLGEHVIDLVAAEYHRRACNPKPWAVFHETMSDALPRWRLPARWHHRRMARRYWAMFRAGTYIGCKPA